MQQTLSHYRLEGEIGRGGMGVVYRAVDTRLRRALAIKVLPPEATADGDRNERFVREAQAASALNHPNIVTIYDIDQEAGVTFIAMELVEGTPLDRLLAKGPLPVDETLEYARQIAAALAAAHAAGIVHRDIKPGNIVITSDRRAKVLDFGLAKLVERDGSADTMTAFGTQAGLILGTAAYMSPEQAEGRGVDARSDIFSLGAVIYEMLAGRRAFTADSDLRLLTAILRDQPPPLAGVRGDVPAPVSSIVERCLAKDPAARYQEAAALAADLARALTPPTPPARAPWRRAAVMAPLALVLIAAVGAGVWKLAADRRARDARERLVPAIEQALSEGRPLQAVRLTAEAEPYAADEVARIRRQWATFRLATEPPAADVALADYAAAGDAWMPVGQTPIGDVLLPFGYYRVRITKAGFVPLEISVPMMGRPPVRLTPEAEAVAGMVRVPGGPFSVGVASEVTLPDYWIGRHEVTNREFRRFVDAGGYRDAKYWKEPFTEGGRQLSFNEAMARFVDTTGRPGPSTWELGTYAAEQDNLPVGGISWFEAAAYAAFAGGSLPSIWHWHRAAGTGELFSDIVQASNFDSGGPTAVGERHGIGPWGTTDMAGNVQEWCLNQAAATSRRFILGGAWNEPSYRFHEEDAQDPWLRRPTFGMRLVKNLGPVKQLTVAIGRVFGDPRSLVPAPDELVNVYSRFYEYDRTPLNARIDAVDESVAEWRKESVSFDAAYGGQRVPAYLFLPKNARPPYQTVVFFPSAYALGTPSSRVLDLRTFEFIVRSGRALLYPVYQGTFERRGTPGRGPAERRDLQVQWAKDFFRAVDYLWTRPDIDKDRLAYYSLSMGASFGPIPVSLEPRIKAAIFVAGGLWFNQPPEVQAANFAPRVRVPVLVVHGRDDFTNPVEVQRRFVELLGTPAEHKRHAVLDGGHVPMDMRGLFRETFDFLDKHFGPVR